MRWLLFFLIPLTGFADWRRDWIIEQVNASDIREIEATGSMKDVFDEKYLLMVRKVPFESLKVGMFIIYRSSDPKATYPLIVHAIYSRSSNGSLLVMKGLNNEMVDEQLVRKEDYVGKVVGWVLKE